ncbi:hypothetical protein [Conexibacter sp. SYSU D00693]|uniref:hypothetical protein n=1 Tax=Conexibacter sp. SYSU D00693 TaxID=2812560 RepID=UPI00196A48B9|nr:hypothetical protein [Conexibacter sp. SYSU D00693]
MAAEPAPAVGAPCAPEVLPETAQVHWRARVDDRRLRRLGALWTLTTLAHVVPFLATGVGLLLLDPITLPVALAAWAHAWIIPELYARRGADVVRPKRRHGRRRPTEEAERTALGLLGDLLGHEARDLQGRTGLVLERGRLGVWLVGEAGALLVRAPRRGPLARGRVHCWCVRVDDPRLPCGDRVAHLLLALRADEQGFATVANQTFSGAPWRVRRRLPGEMRPAVDAAQRVVTTDQRYKRSS